MKVLEFLVETDRPQKVTIKRTTQSKYLYYLVLRDYRKKYGVRPIFLNYAKDQEMAFRSMIEEHSIFSTKRLIALEGFPNAFIRRVGLNDDTRVIAETDAGELEADTNILRDPRNLLKVLMKQMDGDWSVRELLKVDWSALRGVEDVEPLLRRAKILGWTEEDISKNVKGQDYKELLQDLKRGKMKELCSEIDRHGPIAMISRLTRLISQTMHTKVLHSMGVDSMRVEKELGTSRGRTRELEEAAKALTNADLTSLAERLVYMDGFMRRRPKMGIELYLLNNPIKIR